MGSDVRRGFLRLSMRRMPVIIFFCFNQSPGQENISNSVDVQYLPVKQEANLVDILVEMSRLDIQVSVFLLPGVKTWETHLPFFPVILLLPALTSLLTRFSFFKKHTGNHYTFLISTTVVLFGWSCNRLSQVPDLRWMSSMQMLMSLITLLLFPGTDDDDSVCVGEKVCILCFVLCPSCI